MNVADIFEGYFAGEKFESVWIVAAGLLALATAVALWITVRQPFARGLAATLLLTAALGLVVGGTVYLRTDRQVAQLQELHAVDPARFSAEEGARIATVIRSFSQYRLAYATAVILAALGLTIDHYAEERARAYQTALAESRAVAAP